MWVLNIPLHLFLALQQSCLFQRWSNESLDSKKKKMTNHNPILSDALTLKAFPSCGFGSTREGNHIEKSQRAKNTILIGESHSCFAARTCLRRAQWKIILQNDYPRHFHASQPELLMSFFLMGDTDGSESPKT